MIIFWKKIPNNIELKLIEICYGIHRRALITNSQIKGLSAQNTKWTIKFAFNDKILIEQHNSYWTAKSVVDNLSIFYIFGEILLFCNIVTNFMDPIELKVFNKDTSDIGML